MSDLAESRLRRLAGAFDRRLYVEIQRHGLEAERAIEPALIRLADRFSLPLVATNEPFFATRSDYDAHDALLCVAEGAVISASDRRRLSPEHRFKSRAEMTALFADLPEATEASVEIALRCAYRPVDAASPFCRGFRFRAAPRSTRRRSFAARRAKGSRRASLIMASRRGKRPKTTTSVSPSSSMSS